MLGQHKITLGSRVESRRSNVYLTEFRKTNAFRTKRVGRLAPALALLQEYNTPASLHAHAVLLRWYHLVHAQHVDELNAAADRANPAITPHNPTIDTSR